MIGVSWVCRRLKIKLCDLERARCPFARTGRADNRLETRTKVGADAIKCPAALGSAVSELIAPNSERDR